MYIWVVVVYYLALVFSTLDRPLFRSTTATVPLGTLDALLSDLLDALLLDLSDLLLLDLLDLLLGTREMS